MHRKQKDPDELPRKAAPHSRHKHTQNKNTSLHIPWGISEHLRCSRHHTCRRQRGKTWFVKLRLPEDKQAHRQLEFKHVTWQCSRINGRGARGRTQDRKRGARQTEDVWMGKASGPVGELCGMIQTGWKAATERTRETSERGRRPASQQWCHRESFQGKPVTIQCYRKVG